MTISKYDSASLDAMRRDATSDASRTTSCVVERCGIGVKSGFSNHESLGSPCCGLSATVNLPLIRSKTKQLSLPLGKVALLILLLLLLLLKILLDVDSDEQML